MAQHAERANINIDKNVWKVKEKKKNHNKIEDFLDWNFIGQPTWPDQTSRELVSHEKYVVLILKVFHSVKARVFYSQLFPPRGFQRLEKWNAKDVLWSQLFKYLLTASLTRCQLRKHHNNELFLENIQTSPTVVSRSNLKYIRNSFEKYFETLQDNVINACSSASVSAAIITSFYRQSPASRPPSTCLEW